MKAEDFNVVGVTGTNGKSTTTTWIARALAARGGPVARITTLGFYLGEERIELPRRFDGMLAGVERLQRAGGKAFVVEYTSHALARGMAEAWPARVAVFTNFTRDHLDEHGTPEHYLASKAQLFRNLPPGGTAVLNAADPAGELLGLVVPAHARTLRYGVSSRGDVAGEVDLLASDVRVSTAGTTARLSGACDGELSLRAHGAIYVENALAALLGAHAAGVPFDTAREVLARELPPEGRFQIVAERPTVVVDYAHTPDALARTLTAARALTPSRVVLLFGAGGERDREKRPLMGAAARAADRVFVTSDNPRSEAPAAIAEAILEGLGDHADVRVELDRRRAIALAITTAQPDDLVLLAGKGHEATQERDGRVVELSDRAIALEALGRRS